MAADLEEEEEVEDADETMVGGGAGDAFGVTEPKGVVEPLVVRFNGV